MIKRLKRQFVLVNMVLVLLVIIPIFIFMQASTKRDMEKDSYMALEEGLKQFGDANIVPYNDNRPTNAMEDIGFGIGGGPEQESEFKSQSFFETFFVMLDSDYNIVETLARSDFSIDGDELDNIIREVIEKDNVQGVLDDYNLRYKVKKYTDIFGNSFTSIGFNDITYEKMMLSNSRDMYIMVTIIILLIFFIISIYLSNLMIKPIENSWKQQQQFVSDVSHELKTPTAVILANTSILSMNDDLREDKKWVDYIDIEAKRMKKLIEDLLFLSKTDSGKNEKILSSFYLNDVLLDILLPFEAVLYESKKNVELVTEIADDCKIKGDESQIKQLVAIMVDNAYKYSLPNTKINVELYKDNIKNNGILIVNNMSEVIDKEDLDRIFDRFYKVDRARTREGNSHGLGLSIAREIILNHNAKIKVKSDVENGTTFRITFALIH